MVIAALGRLPPAAGAVTQEGIDVLAIGMALRAVLPGRTAGTPVSASDVATAQRLRREHDSAAAVIDQIRAVADALSTQQVDLDPAHALLNRLEDDVIPHERADQKELVPLIDRALGGGEGSAALSRAHAEIEHQVTQLRTLLAARPDTGICSEDVIELRRLLYGLYAILRLHNAQEDEGASSLVGRGSGDGSPGVKGLGSRTSRWPR